MRHQFIGRNADGRAVGVGVAVQVDQPRRDELAAGIHHALRTFGGNRRLDGFDQAVANADVALARQAAARIECIGIANQQVEFVIRPHGREHRARERAQGAQSGEGSAGFE